jgi:hypothetical protein
MKDQNMKTPQIAALPGMSPLGLPITETARHTPGPWRAMPDGAIQKDAAMPTGAAVIAYARHADEKTMRANAALIASAPDLLAALRTILATASCRDATYQNNIQLAEAVDVARAAIAKAEGR